MFTVVGTMVTGLLGTYAGLSCVDCGGTLHSNGSHWILSDGNSSVWVRSNAATPYGIVEPWSDPALEIAYTVTVGGSVAYQKDALGLYERNGNCDGRPYFECVDCRYFLYYNFGWFIGERCGSSFAYLVSFDDAEIPMNISRPWREYNNGEYHLAVVSITIPTETTPPSPVPARVFDLVTYGVFLEVQHHCALLNISADRPVFACVDCDLVVYFDAMHTRWTVATCEAEVLLTVDDPAETPFAIVAPFNSSTGANIYVRYTIRMTTTQNDEWSFARDGSFMGYPFFRCVQCEDLLLYHENQEWVVSRDGEIELRTVSTARVPTDIKTTWTDKDGLNAGVTVVFDGLATPQPTTGAPSLLPTTETSFPSSAPTTSMPTPLPPTDAPTIVIEAPAVARTFAELRASLQSSNITVAGRILFLRELVLAGRRGLTITSGMLDGQQRTRIFRVTQDFDLTLRGLRLEHGYSDDFFGGGLLHISDAVVTLINSTLTASTAVQGGALSVLNARIFGISCEFSMFQAGDIGGAIAAETSHLSFESTSFHSCVSGKRGGAVAISSSWIDLQDSTMTECSAVFEGGALVVDQLSVAVLRNVSLLGNSALYGGAMFSQLSETLILDSIFEANLVLARTEPENSDVYPAGGALCLFGGVTNVVNSTFVKNEASREETKRNDVTASGGAAHGAFMALVVFNECSFTKNTGSSGGAVSLNDANGTFLESAFFENSATSTRDTEGGAGGAIDSRDAILRIDRTRIFKNWAMLAGGGIASNSAITGTVVNVDIQDSEITKNSALRATGGGVMIVRGTSKIRRSLFLKNDAEGFGGGLGFLDGSGDVEDSVFHSNIARPPFGGGGVGVRSNADLKFRRCDFRYNVAVGNASTKSLCGGGLLVMTGSTVSLEGLEFFKNSAPFGGALAVTEGGNVHARGPINATANSALKGGFLYIESLSSAEISNTSLFENNAAIKGTAMSCGSSSTIYAAFLTWNDDPTIALARSCAIFMYLSNRDGSPEYKATTFEKVLRSESDVGANIVDTHHYTYPCPRGSFSIDGLQRGNTSVDRHGRTIAENEFRNLGTECVPSCDSLKLDLCVDCATGCQSCPAGKYLGFTLDPVFIFIFGSCVLQVVIILEGVATIFFFLHFFLKFSDFRVFGFFVFHNNFGT